MDENLQNIEELFRDELENLEIRPPQAAWDSIDNSLDKKRIITITKKYRLYRDSTVLLVLLLIGVSSYFLYYKPEDVLRHSSTGMYIDSLQNLQSNTHSYDKISFSESLNIKTSKLNANKNKLIDSVDKTDEGISFPAQSTVSKDVNLNKLNKFQIAHQSTILFLKSKESKNQESHLHYTIINSILDSVSQLQDLTYNNVYGGNLARNISNPPLAVLDIRSDIKPLNSLLFNDDINLSLKKQTTSKFSFVPFISIDKSWYYLQKDLPDNQPDNYDQIQKSEKHDLSVTAGLWLNFKIKKHWALQTGLSYSQTNITVDPKEIYAQNDNQGKIKYRINTSTGYGFILPTFSSHPVLGDSIYSFTSNHTLEYITLPFAVQYNIYKNKFEFFMNGGLAIHFLTKTSIETTLEKGFYNESEIINKMQGVKKLYVGGLIGAGLAYKINSKFALTYFPTFHFALSSINNNTPVRTYPYSIGQSIGIKLTL